MVQNILSNLVLICEVAISAWFSFKMLFIWFVLWIVCGGNHNWETNDLARSVSTHERHGERHGERHERHGGRHGIDDLHSGRQARHSAILVSKGYSKKKLAIRF